MTQQFTSGKFGFEQVFSLRGAGNATPNQETPFRVLVMGDFSGRIGGGQPAGAARPPLRVYKVDQENLDGVIAKLEVEVRLPIRGEDKPPEVIRFSDMESFHPDSLYKRMQDFQAIRDSRKKIQDPPYVPAKEEKPAVIPEQAESEKGLFESLLQGKSSVGSRSGSSQGLPELDRFLKQVVKPHVDPHSEERKSVLKTIDEATGALMRAVLHFPGFQRLEAAWRGIDFILSRIEMNEHLELFLLDISKAELAADLCSTDDLSKTAIYKLLVEKTVGTPGGKPWAVLAGDFTFDCSVGDIEVLGRMAKIARAAGAPFLAEADTALLGCGSAAGLSDPDRWKRSDEENRAWKALRSLKEASWIGLALPGFLLRLPYGAKTEPIESFDFKEFPALPEPTDYLWGNPCFFVACLLAGGFREEGWGFQPGVILELDGLPVHIYQDGGEKKCRPCAGVLISHTAAEAILENGIMPLLSFKDQDRVRLARFQSIAYPPAGLSGRWGEET